MREREPTTKTMVSDAEMERPARLDRERMERFGTIDRLREAFAGVLPEEIEHEADRAVAELWGKVAAETA